MLDEEMAMPNYNNGFIVAESSGVSAFTYRSTKTVINLGIGSCSITPDAGNVCQQIGSFNCDDGGDANEVFKSILLSPNEKYLIVIKNCCAYIFTTGDLHLIYKIQRSLEDVSFSPCGSYLVGWTGTDATSKSNSNNSLDETNFNIWLLNDLNTSSPTLVHSQKRSKQPIVQFSNNEKICAILSNNSLHFFSTTNFALIIQKTPNDLQIRSFSLSATSSANGSQLYVLVTSSPSPTSRLLPVIQLYKYPNMESPFIDEGYETGDQTEIKWNKAGTAALVIVGTMSHRSAVLYHLDVKGDFKKITTDSILNLQSCSIMTAQWAPNSIEFCLIVEEPNEVFSSAVIMDDKLEATIVGRNIVFNSIYYNSKGNTVLLCGTDHVQGNIIVYDLENKQKLSELPESSSSELIQRFEQVVWLGGFAHPCAFFGTDGVHFITAIAIVGNTSNCHKIKVWNVTGSCVYVHEGLNELYKIIPVNTSFSISPGTKSNNPLRKSINEPMSNLPANATKTIQNSRLLGHYKVVRRLGIGGFGVVIEVINIGNNQHSSTKLIPLQTSRFTSKSLHNEVEKLSKIPKHQNVVEYITSWKETLNAAELEQLLLSGVGTGKVVRDKLNLEKNLMSLDIICIQVELCDSDLRKWITSRNKCVRSQGDIGNLDFKLEMNIFRQLVNGLEHIHKHDLIHRDLKPTNVLLVTRDNNCNVKIGDFGLAVLHVDGWSIGDCHTANAGNAFYKAPEQSYPNYGKGVDIFALGLILYELIDPSIINTSESFLKLRSKNKLPDYTCKNQPKLRQLILDMINVDRESRPSLTTIRGEISRDQAESSLISASNHSAVPIGDRYSEESFCSCCLSKITTSIKYKCVVCPNISLCETCEGHSKYEHGAHKLSHPLFKLRREIQEPIDKPVELQIGCQHYQRKCKIMCPHTKCKGFYWCNWCHDNSVTDHVLERTRVNVIQCGQCGATQAPSQECNFCNIKFAEYYCKICHLYDNCDEASQLYSHCDKCGVCRKKQSHGVEYFHCDSCWKCVPDGSPHKCERSNQSACPIWHYVHKTSKREYMSVKIKCPVCGQW